MAMKVREWLNKNSALVTVGAVVLLGGALYVIYRVLNPSPPPPMPTKVWYVDLATGKRFAAAREEVPPIEAPSRTPIGEAKAPGGVRAFVMTCGECSGDEMFETRYEMFTPEAKQLQLDRVKMLNEMVNQPPPKPGELPPMGGMDMMAMKKIEEGRLVARASEPEKWFAQQSPDGQKVMMEGADKCPGGRYPKECFPPN